MRNMMRTMILAVAVAGLLAPTWAMADDLFHPPWDRFGPTSTFSHWRFDGFLPPELPDEQWNPFGECMIVSPIVGWLPEWEGRQGVIQPEFAMPVEIWNPNDYEPRDYKEIQLQVTWWDPLGMGIPPEAWVDSPVGGGPLDLMDVIPIGPGVNWWYGRWYGMIQPNPPEEIVILDFLTAPIPDVYIDQIVLDTICIPEPATVSLLALGFLPFILRRRRE